MALFTMDDDDSRPSRIRRDGEDRERGAGQTHGASDASGVDVEAAPPADGGTPAAPPDGVHFPSSSD